MAWKEMSGRRKFAAVVAVLAVLVGGFVAADRLLGPEPVEPTPVKATPTKTVPPKGERLELGTSAKISDNYSVAVTEIVVYEGKETQLLAATIKAEYIGSDEGEPWADLSAEYVEKTGWTADEASCPSSLEAAAEKPLAVGDVTTHVACMNLRSKNVEGGRVYVEEALADSRRVAWSTDDAVTKPLPSPPRVTGAGGGSRAAPSWRPPGRELSEDDKEELEEFEEWKDSVRDYKRWTDEVDEKVDKYSSNKKKIEEWRDWKEDFDEDYEEWEKVYGD
jgi:hypothetical protein